MVLYYLMYSDCKGKAFEIEAVCTNKQSANEMLHSWYDSEMALYGKYLEIQGVISINVQDPSCSIAYIACKELNQWKKMDVVCWESDEWIWFRPEPKAEELKEIISFE